ncbi:ATP-dependent DNA ligase [Vibrio phage D529]
MNIFEFLGKPSDWRTGDKVVQLVKHFDDVNKRLDEGILHKKVEFPMYAQCKKDGNFAALVVRADGEVALFNRRGSRFTNCENVEAYWKGAGIKAGVYFGELCSEECSLEQLSGVVNPNRIKGLDYEQKLIKHRLNIFFFDAVTICEFISGHSHRGFLARFDVMVTEIDGYGDWLSLERVCNESELRGFAQRMIANGQEGAVFKQDVEWLAGAKDWHQMKVVRGVSYDLMCIGYEEGKGKYAGKVANLIFQWKNGKTIKCMLGKGWTHADAERLFNNIDMVCTPDCPIGQVFEVYALQESSKGVLRLPKCGELRHDKSEADI